MNLELRVHRHIGFSIDSDAKLVALKCRKFVGVRSLVMNTLLNRIILKKNTIEIIQIITSYFMKKNCPRLFSYAFK